MTDYGARPIVDTVPRGDPGGWKAPPDTMREELPGRGNQERFPRSGTDYDEQQRIAGWAQAVLGVRVEFASKGYDSTLMLCEGSDWAVRTLRSIVIGFRVVRVVPLPKEDAHG